MEAVLGPPRAPACRIGRVRHLRPPPSRPCPPHSRQPPRPDRPEGPGVPRRGRTMRVAAADRSRHAHGPSGPTTMRASTIASPESAAVITTTRSSCTRPPATASPKDEQRERLTGSACPRRGGGVLPFPTFFTLPPPYWVATGSARPHRLLPVWRDMGRRAETGAVCQPAGRGSNRDESGWPGLNDEPVTGGLLRSLSPWRIPPAQLRLIESSRWLAGHRCQLSAGNRETVTEVLQRVANVSCVSSTGRYGSRSLQGQGTGAEGGIGCAGRRRTSGGPRCGSHARTGCRGGVPL